MLRATRWALIPAVLAGWLFLTGPADAAAPEVKDEGKFFSAETTAKANRVIAEIKQTHRKDLIIETYQTVPDGQADKVRQMTPDARNSYFRSWMAERARAVKADGVFILINRDPQNLQVDAGKETAKKHFTEANERELAGILRKKFGEKKFDEGLLEAVSFVNDTMRSNVKATSSAPTRSSPAPTQHTAEGRGESGWGGVICWGLVILAGIWLFVGLIRAFTGGMGGGGYGGGYGGYGGGGFFPSLMGGLFGTMAGMWMYNSFFGGGSSWGSSAYGSDAGTSAASDEGQGFGDGSGGDFGDSGDSGGSSGGDWGGGDSGGGDWGGGGGDWGGGGGDFGGGGGGDW